MTMGADVRDQSVLWEPWDPAYGQHVQFCIGECPRSHGGIKATTGVIVPCGDAENHEPQYGHRFHIELDSPILCSNGLIVQVIAAAAELTPLPHQRCLSFSVYAR